MFKRYNIGDQAVIVYIFSKKSKEKTNLSEFKSLISSAGIKILHIIISNNKTLHPKYLIGKGKAYEISEVVKNNNASIVCFNHVLSPSQERNLELLCKCQIIDYTSLVLSIFAQRAYTHEGRLQVELAQLQYLSTRLVRSWTHLERQKGGIGFHGPGETQLEIDRRLLNSKSNKILLRLKKIEKRREQGRCFRKRENLNTISLVGYTNTGKSTLFNFITHAYVHTDDQFFTTLDPVLRRINISEIGNTVLIDTVGFIRQLPTHLIKAFKSTLQETIQANLLLHIVDASDYNFEQNIKSVKYILSEIKAVDIPILLVMNKIDKLKDNFPRIDRDKKKRPIRVWISAKKGYGIKLLIQAIAELIVNKTIQYELKLPSQAGLLRSQFYQLQAIKKEWIDNDGSIRLIVKLSDINWYKLCKKEKMLLNYIVKLPLKKIS